MNLSEHFTLDEMIFSETALRKGIDNTPGDLVKINLRKLCETVLEPLRAKVGKPIRITSGYRSPALNAAIGGVKNSQHQFGQAADTHVDGMTIEELYQFIKAAGIPFDQLIQEFGEWVHVSWAPTLRNECLRAVKENGVTKYNEDTV